MHLGFTVQAADISIHALREEGDSWSMRALRQVRQFLSTPSARRATGLLLILQTAPIFLSTPSARRATRLSQSRFPAAFISIHALREEGDKLVLPIIYTSSNFYPRPPRGGRRSFFVPISSSTDFYPRPPRGGRPAADAGIHQLPDISIHALREEGDDVCKRYPDGWNNKFLSTPSARRATIRRRVDRWVEQFLSTPSARRATRAKFAHIANAIFLSTPSARRATMQGLNLIQGKNISIHALREEGDSAKREAEYWPCYFYPRPPRGGRPLDLSNLTAYALISIHALREEGDS